MDMIVLDAGFHAFYWATNHASNAGVDTRLLTAIWIGVGLDTSSPHASVDGLSCCYSLSIFIVWHISPAFTMSEWQTSWCERCLFNFCAVSRFLFQTPLHNGELQRNEISLRWPCFQRHPSFTEIGSSKKNRVCWLCRANPS